LGNKIENFFTNDNQFPIDHPNYRKAVLLNCIIISFTFISILFSILNIIAGSGLHIVVVQLIAAALMYSVRIYFYKSKNLEYATVLAVALVIVYTYYHFISIDLRTEFIAWIIIMPLLYFFLVKRKTALIISLSYMLVISVTLIVKYIKTGEVADLRIIINYLGAELVFIFFTFYFERSGWVIANELKIKNRMLKRLAEIDNLTGLYNRNAINEHLEKIVKNDTTFSVIMLDIDDFKTINDRFGHFIGDRVLEEVGLVLQTFSNRDVFCGRWGGEEFLIICNSKNEAEAYQYAEEIRKKLISSAFLNGEGIPTSMGVAEHIGEEDPTETITCADKALYVAKSNGKGRVESCKNCSKV